MVIDVPSNYKAFQLIITIKSVGEVPIAIKAFDPNKSNTFYINRGGVVKGQRVFKLKFPVSPSWIKIAIFNPNNGNMALAEDDTFSVEDVKVQRLDEYDVWWNKETKDFYKFAVSFSENASVLNAGHHKNPVIYKSDDNKFRIDYYNVITDDKTGAELSTPARVAHSTGIIEVSKRDFEKYSVPMRLIILLHEFAHKYLNPKIGKPIESETGADIQALYIYLGKGWSPVEAHLAFLHVFKTAANDSNHKRYKIIDDFILKYEKGLIERRL
jgi:hypothetical protein